MRRLSKDSEAEVILTFVFRRSGRPALRESEIYLPLAMDLGWFTMEQAQRFVDSAISSHLLEKEEGLLRPAFDIDNVEVPLGFVPSSEIEELTPKKNDEKEQADVVSYICEHTGRKKAEIEEEISTAAEKMGVLFDVAGVLVARKYNLPITELAESVEQSLLAQ